MLGQVARLGFTLAEVLITLGIIGIVAALTIPFVINKYNSKVFETEFKKANSVILRALDMTAQEYGATNFKELKFAFCGDLGQFDQDTDKQNACNESITKELPNINATLRNYLGIVDQEKITTNSYSMYNFEKDRFNYTNLCAFSDELSHLKCTVYYLKDGSSFLGLSYREAQFTLIFDTNGPRKNPNRLGYDIWEYEYPKWRNCGWCNMNSGNWMSGLGCYYCAIENVDSDNSDKGGYWQSLY